jgi:hypothetical protein
MLTFYHFLSCIASGGNWTRTLDHVISIYHCSTAASHPCYKGAYYSSKTCGYVIKIDFNLTRHFQPLPLSLLIQFNAIHLIYNFTHLFILFQIHLVILY